jgi:hypothetical protein
MTLLKPALLTAASSARLERGRRGHPAGRLASGVARKLKARDVTDPLADPLADLFRPRGARAGPATSARTGAPRSWLGPSQPWTAGGGAKTARLAPGRPWETGCAESFNARLRADLLTGDLFSSLRKAKIAIERWQSNAGTSPPTPSGLTPRRATGPPPQRSSSPPSPPGRPHHSDPLRQPGSPWRPPQRQTHITPHPTGGGQRDRARRPDVR